MCQTLFFIPAYLAGYPVFGPGLLLAVWAVVSVGVLARLAWRQGWNADTWSYVLILLLIGAIIRWVLPALCEPQGLPIRGYGVMNMLAVIAGTLLAAWRAKRVGLDPDLMFSLIFWMLVPGIIGARAFYVIEYWKTQYWPAYTNPGGGLGPLLAAIVNIPRRRTGDLRGIFRRHGGRAPVRPQASPAAAGPLRPDCPQHGLGPGHRADRLPDERLLLRRRLRLPLGDHLSARRSALSGPGRTGADVRIHAQRQSEGGTAGAGRPAQLACRSTPA